MDRPAVLSLTRVDKSYGRVRALGDLGLEIVRGEDVALLGTAGAGKSTLVHLIAGLVSPDAGGIATLGRDIRHDRAAAHAAAGVVFDESTLDLDQSVRGNLDYQADLFGLDRSAARIFANELLAGLGVAGVTADRVRSLSPVNRRRVELVRAMLHQPALLVVDAVDAGLGGQSRLDLVADLRLARPEGTALLWATDNPDEAEGAERVVVLHRGHVIFDGAPAALVEAGGAADMQSAFSRLISAREK